MAEIEARISQMNDLYCLTLRESDLQTVKDKMKVINTDEKSSIVKTELVK